ncbi:MAG: DMT family transporter [Fibrobacterales bacterium]
MQSTILITVLSLAAFAANSILCRFALSEPIIDPASFTAIRLISGAVTLAILMLISTPRSLGTTIASCRAPRYWFGSLFLFSYAALFSYAYRTLDTGTGALILFGTVQLTMITFTLITQRTIKPTVLIGTLIAFSGLIYLVIPTVTTPSLMGFLAMTGSGIAWALYTLLGSRSKNPLRDTTIQFTLTIPLCIALLAIMPLTTPATTSGVLAAIASGSLASGIGYALWYRTLPHLTSTTTGVVQLSVPILASLGGILLLGELVSLRLIIASITILGGIFIVIQPWKQRSAL